MILQIMYYNVSSQPQNQKQRMLGQKHFFFSNYACFYCANFMHYILIVHTDAVVNANTNNSTIGTGLVNQ